MFGPPESYETNGEHQVHFAPFIDDSEFVSLIDEEEQQQSGAAAVGATHRQRGSPSHRWRRGGVGTHNGGLPSSESEEHRVDTAYYAAAAAAAATTVPPSHSFDSRTDGSVVSELGGLIPNCDSRDWAHSGIPKADSRDWAHSGIPKADSRDWMQYSDTGRRQAFAMAPPSHHALRGIPQFGTHGGGGHQLEDLLSILAAQVSSPIDHTDSHADVVVGEVTNALGLASTELPDAQEVESEASGSDRSDSDSDHGLKLKGKRKNDTRKRHSDTAPNKKRVTTSPGGMMMGLGGYMEEEEEEDDDFDEIDEDELAPEAKAELTRQRNREHARSTRRRKKQYVDQLKRQVAELLAKQQLLNSLDESQNGSSFKMSPERIEEVRVRKTLISDFLSTRLNDCRDREMWRRLVDDHVKTTRPRTPYRAELPGSCLKPTSGQGSVLRLKGIDALVRDAVSLTEMRKMIERRLNKIQPASKTKNIAIQLESICKHEDILLVGDRCMGHWRIRSNGLTKCECFQSELELDGFVRASFHKNKLRDIELCFDPNTWAHQLIAANLLDISMLAAEVEVRREKAVSNTTGDTAGQASSTHKGSMVHDDATKAKPASNTKNNHTQNLNGKTRPPSSMPPLSHPNIPAAGGLLGLHHVLGMNPLASSGPPRPPFPRAPAGFRPPPGLPSRLAGFPFAPPFVRPPIFLGDTSTEMSSSNKKVSPTTSTASIVHNGTHGNNHRPPFLSQPMLIPPGGLSAMGGGGRDSPRLPTPNSTKTSSTARGPRLPPPSLPLVLQNRLLPPPPRPPPPSSSI